MIDPSLPVQAAVFAQLTAAAPVGTGVYDHVPLDNAGKIKAPFPFYHIGEDQVISDADQCHDPSTVYVSIHTWSRTPGKVEAKRLNAIAVLALDTALTVDGFVIIGHKVERIDHLTDADGVTAHSVAVIRYRLGPIT